MIQVVSNVSALTEDSWVDQSYPRNFLEKGALGQLVDENRLFLQTLPRGSSFGYVLNRTHFVPNPNNPRLEPPCTTTINFTQQFIEPDIVPAALSASRSSLAVPLTGLQSRWHFDPTTPMSRRAELTRTSGSIFAHLNQCCCSTTTNGTPMSSELQAVSTDSLRKTRPCPRTQQQQLQARGYRVLFNVRQGDNVYQCAIMVQRQGFPAFWASRTSNN